MHLITAAGVCPLLLTSKQLHSLG
uniref:Uncharacterized protein n=1 Tax=Anguilla anguilla TaxID=7936 RepID=A0A0E9THQ9_ANGAN